MNFFVSGLVLFFWAVQAQANVRMAITVDDLPVHGDLPSGVSRKDVTKKMISIFKKHGVSEVYGFINAGEVERNPKSFEVLKLWKDANFPFGNHTYLHRDLTQSSIIDFKSEIDRNEPMLKNISGTHDWKYFRYPYLREGESLGKRNAIRKYLDDQGYKIAQVTVDFEDWSWNAPYARCMNQRDEKAISWLKASYIQNANDILDRSEFIAKALFQRSIPHILLLHIGAFDAETLDQLLISYSKKGVEFISLSEAIRDPIYSIDPGIPAQRGSEFIYQILRARGLTLKDIGLSPYGGYPSKQLSEVCL